MPKRFAKVIAFVSCGLICYSLASLTISTNESDPDNVAEIRMRFAAEPGDQADNEPESQSPLKSGPISVVPWEKDERFLDCQANNGTPVMLAAFRTVLRDPLPGEEENVRLAARLLAGTIVKPGGVFSQNGTIGPYTKSRGFKEGPAYIGPHLVKTIGGGVCKIASTLYNVAILSNLQVIERHYHSMPVPYVPYGQDATVSYGNKDFKFKNNTGSPVLIWAQGIGNVLYMAFYGVAAPPGVTWHHEVLGVTRADKVYKTNSSLPKGSEKLLSEGMDGAVVKSWLTIRNPDGTETRKELGTSYYKPLPHLYEIGR